MNQVALITTLMQAGVARGTWPLPKDKEYSPVSVEFIRDALPVWVDSFPSELLTMVDVGGGKTARRPRWEVESGDCDNIAFDFLAFLSRCMWAEAIRSGQPRGNVAAGAFYFIRPPGHAIVWFVDHNGVVHHCDPGSFEIDHLTVEQLGSIYGGEYA